MTEWTPETIERLFDRYERHFDQLVKDSTTVNCDLASKNPKKTQLQRLTRTEFQQILTDRTNDSEAIELWVKRIVRGHEEEFSTRQAG
ncbi:hypothetical protein [Roseimaritima ulvae]|uniref:Uncharacterized protein n=1 Tax=Roseimaritima ulvae TaxID=980254 RepID=A0A5B9QMS5_9BACT|nr:hypothetical protein [Roseimaritima ulvae]QEG38920.1 hypothetical protein UC8_08790 [Roseimaritima ulvae]